MPPSRYRYTPALRGWVVTRDMLRAVIDSIDCSQGGAQETFTAKCTELTSEGWTLGRRFADSVFAERGPDRVRVTIEAYDPHGPVPLYRSTP